MIFQLIAMLVIGIFCLSRAFYDWRERRYGWAVYGLCCAGLLLTVPIPTHAVELELPPLH